MKVPWLLSVAACAIGLLVGATRGQLKSEVGPMTSQTADRRHSALSRGRDRMAQYPATVVGMGYGV